MLDSNPNHAQRQQRYCSIKPTLRTSSTRTSRIEPHKLEHHCHQATPTPHSAMGYFLTSPQRNSPGRVGVNVNLVMSRGAYARPLMVPSPRSPAAQRADRPLADVLDDNAPNPLRRKYDPSKPSAPAPSQPSPSRTVKSSPCLVLAGLPTGLPFADSLANADAAPLVSSSVMGKKPGSTASSFTKSTRYSVPSAVPLPNEATEDEASVTTNAASASPPATRNSRCYAYVSIPSQPPKSETKAALNVTPVVRRKKKVSFLPAKRRSAATTPESEDTRTQDLQRVDQLQHKLDAIQSSKASEIKAIREAVRKEKLQLDDLVRESTLRATFDDEILRRMDANVGVALLLSPLTFRSTLKD
jgi:hypothetical protein